MSNFSQSPTGPKNSTHLGGIDSLAHLKLAIAQCEDLSEVSRDKLNGLVAATEQEILERENLIRSQQTVMEDLGLSLTITKFERDVAQGKIGGEPE